MLMVMGHYIDEKWAKEEGYIKTLSDLDFQKTTIDCCVTTAISLADFADIVLIIQRINQKFPMYLLIPEEKEQSNRLAENKGSPIIDWETVYCMVKI